MIRLMVDWLLGDSSLSSLSIVRDGDAVLVRALLAAVFAFFFSLAFGPRLIRKLISLKFGQPLRTEEEVRQLAALHAGKKGTPTMGGILILTSMMLSVLIFGHLTNMLLWIAVFVLVSHGCIGFLDDYAKIKGQNSKGLSSRQKLCGQTVIGVLAGIAYYCCGIFAPEHYGYHLAGVVLEPGDLYLPGWGQVILSLDWGIVPLFVLVIVGSSNAVNLTDGLDGLAIGCTITTAVAYSWLALALGQVAVVGMQLNGPHCPAVAELGIVMAAMLGAGCGFLKFNRYPAKVFMGDTGSLAIGACIGVVALMCKMELLLVIIGAVFVVEALSVMIQVTSYRYRQQRRVFRCAPLHHHFQLGGWHERKVIHRFWLASLVAATLGISILFIK